MEDINMMVNGKMIKKMGKELKLWMDNLVMRGISKWI